jgi:low affinity Fe/Cu permease
MRSFLSGSSEVTFQSWVFKFLSDSGMWIGYVWWTAILFKYSGNTCSISVFIVKIVYILLSSICTCIRLIEFSARRMWSMKTGSSFARIVGCSTLLLSNECFFYRLCLTVHGDG